MPKQPKKLPKDWYKQPISEDAKSVLGKNEQKEIWGIIPINPIKKQRAFQDKLNALLRGLSQMSVTEQRKFREQGVIDLVEDKTGYSLFTVYCKNCGSKVATVWATDETLTDWCDLHYYTLLTPTGWAGCLAVNDSPIDGRLGFECACGMDTRDYRVNKSLPPIAKQFMIEQNEKQRPFDKPSSGFVALPDGSSQKSLKTANIVMRINL